MKQNNATILQDLQAKGFRGFVPVGALRSGTSVIPEIQGVYLVIRTADVPPVFLSKGSGGFFKGKDPNVPLSNLSANWVEDEQVVYIGMTRSSLRKRIRTYLLFGKGEPVGHYGGRLIWQLQDHEDLLFCWKPMPVGDPDQMETELIDAFKSAHGGRRPFANLTK